MTLSAAEGTHDSRSWVPLRTDCAMRRRARMDSGGLPQSELIRAARDDLPQKDAKRHEGWANRQTGAAIGWETGTVI